MGKKCIICEIEAVYKIKDTADFYCEECAQDNFNDLTLLVKVEEEAQRLKPLVMEECGEEKNDKNDEKGDAKRNDKLKNRDDLKSDDDLPSP
jgi:hypothetical protein